MREEIVEVDPAVDCSSHHGVKLGSLEVCSDNFIQFAVAQNLNNKTQYLVSATDQVTKLFSFKQEVLRTSMAF